MKIPNLLRPVFLIGLVCTASLADAGVRYRYFNNQLEVEVSHNDGLLGYVIKSNGRNGNLEASPSLTDCPGTDTTVLAPQANHLHAHWVMVSTCNGESFMYELNNTTSSWTDATEQPYTPPEQPEDSHVSVPGSSNQSGLVTLLAGIAALASVLSLLLLLLRKPS